MTDSGAGTDSAGRVWYAAYGSNLSRERLLCYLQGGCPPGARRSHAGCADRRAPADDVPATLSLSLSFAGESPVWGGGTAVASPTARPGDRALVRLYLVTVEQLAGIAAQENHVALTPLPVPGAAAPRWYVLNGTPGPPGRYAGVLRCGTRDGIPIVTFTAATPPPAGTLAPPGRAYLAMLAGGLRQAHRLPVPAIAAYLATIPGVGRSRAALAAWLGG